MDDDRGLMISVAGDQGRRFCGRAVMAEAMGAQGGQQ